MLKNKTIVVTQGSEDVHILKGYLEKQGANVYEFPTIRLHKVSLNTEIESVLGNPANYDLLLFTSRHAALFFIEILVELNTKWNHIPSIAIGGATAAILQAQGFRVTMIPQEFTSAGLGQEIMNIEGKRILLPRSQLADDTLPQALKAKGAMVTALTLYTTEYIDTPDKNLEKMLADNDSSLYVTFTSPSTISGFTMRLGKSILDQVIEELPVVCIGPVTAEAARHVGFKHILVADTHTLIGMVNVLLKDTNSHAIS